MRVKREDEGGEKKWKLWFRKKARLTDEGDADGWGDRGHSTE